MSKSIDRRAMLIGGLAVLLAPVVTGGAEARADTVIVYDEHGNKITIDTTTISAPVTYYTAVGAPYVVYPAVPAYVPGPVYGAAGVRGQARRVSRRTARRVSYRR